MEPRAGLEPATCGLGIPALAVAEGRRRAFYEGNSYGSGAEGR